MWIQSEYTQRFSPFIEKAKSKLIGGEFLFYFRPRKTPSGLLEGGVNLFKLQNIGHIQGPGLSREVLPGTVSGGGGGAKTPWADKHRVCV